MNKTWSDGVPCPFGYFHRLGIGPVVGTHTPPNRRALDGLVLHGGQPLGVGETDCRPLPEHEKRTDAIIRGVAVTPNHICHRNTPHSTH